MSEKDNKVQRCREQGHKDTQNICGRYSEMYYTTTTLQQVIHCITLLNGLVGFKRRAIYFLVLCCVKKTCHTFIHFTLSNSIYSKSKETFSLLFPSWFGCVV